jgi:hypothetical protein
MSTEILSYLSSPGRLILARRKLGGWLRNDEKIYLIACDFWTYPGDIGIILQSWNVNGGAEIKMLTLMRDTCVFFCCKVTKFNFDWKSISDFLQDYLC